MQRYTSQQIAQVLRTKLSPEKQKKLGIMLITDLSYRKPGDMPPIRLQYWEDIIKTAHDKKDRTILAYISLDSPSGAKDRATDKLLGHATALKIDLEHKLALYQDSKGYDMLAALRSDLEKVIPGFEIRELKILQQPVDNGVDCGPITIENLVQFSTSNNLNGQLPIPLIRHEHTAILTSQGAYSGPFR